MSFPCAETFGPRKLPKLADQHLGPYRFFSGLALTGHNLEKASNWVRVWAFHLLTRATRGRSTGSVCSQSKVRSFWLSIESFPQRRISRIGKEFSWNVVFRTLNKCVKFTPASLSKGLRWVLMNLASDRVARRGLLNNVRNRSRRTGRDPDFDYVVKLSRSPGDLLVSKVRCSAPVARSIKGSKSASFRKFFGNFVSLATGIPGIVIAPFRLCAILSTAPSNFSRMSLCAIVRSALILGSKCKCFMFGRNRLGPMKFGHISRRTLQGICTPGSTRSRSIEANVSRSLRCLFRLIQPRAGEIAGTDLVIGLDSHFGFCCRGFLKINIPFRAFLVRTLKSGFLTPMGEMEKDRSNGGRGRGCDPEWRILLPKGGGARLPSGITPRWPVECRWKTCTRDVGIRRARFRIRGTKELGSSLWYVERRGPHFGRKSLILAGKTKHEFCRGDGGLLAWVRWATDSVGNPTTWMFPTIAAVLEMGSAFDEINLNVNASAFFLRTILGVDMITFGTASLLNQPSERARHSSFDLPWINPVVTRTDVRFRSMTFNVIIPGTERWRATISGEEEMVETEARFVVLCRSIGINLHESFGARV